MDLFDILKKAAEQNLRNQSREGWIQVGKLGVEDLARLKNLNAKESERQREAKLLMDKVKAFQAQNDVESSEWWLHIHKAYGLPGGDYVVDPEDGRILMPPKEKK